MLIIFVHDSLDHGYLAKGAASNPSPLTSSKHLHVLHRTALFPLYPADVLLADCVPCAHVLFHACAHAALLASREGGTRLGDAALEAVLIEFLWVH